MPCPRDCSGFYGTTAGFYELVGLPPDFDKLSEEEAEALVESAAIQERIAELSNRA